MIKDDILYSFLANGENIHFNKWCSNQIKNYNRNKNGNCKHTN